MRPFSGSDTPAIRRSPLLGSLAGLVLSEKDVPSSFPHQVWAEQSTRYVHYWAWYDGTYLSETITNRLTENAKPIEKYPLKLNPIRDFARKHAAMLLGEEGNETSLPLVRPQITAKPNLMTNRVDEENRVLAILFQNVLNEVWVQSGGRSIQMENALLQQFLGGCVFGVSYIPLKDSRRLHYRVPVVIKNVLPDFFVPIWHSTNYWDLQECFIVYRIPNAIARAQYPHHAGLENLPATGWSIYCEHWTRYHYSIYLNRTPITEKVGDTTITYDRVPNDFGFVPYVYIPHTREGRFFGSSHVDDLEGLTRELNARVADMGDAIRTSVHRRRYATDVVNSKPKNLGADTWAIDLGTTNLTTKVTPDVKSEDPPKLADSLVSFSEAVIWQQLLRAGHLSNIAFGEDDVSQRSAVALAMRMFPSTAHSNIERSYWTEGLNLLSRMVLRILAVKKVDLGGVFVPDYFESRVNFSQDWLPQIPRDREQQVNEIILRFQAGLVSPETALQFFGDIEYIDEEIERIKAWMQFQSTVQGSKTQMGAGAKSELSQPKVTDGMSDE